MSVKLAGQIITSCVASSILPLMKVVSRGFAGQSMPISGGPIWLSVEIDVLPGKLEEVHTLLKEHGR